MKSRPVRFSLLFDGLEPVHLHKDVGQIPFQLQKHFEYDTEIVYSGKKQCFSVDDDLKGLKIKHAGTGMLPYLFANAARIDVLMLFHVKTETIYAALLYKFLNPTGFVYVKYDLPDHELLYARWGHRNLFTQLKRSTLFALFVKKLNLLSVECVQVFNRLNKVSTAKKMHLLNGFDPDIPLYYGVLPKNFEEKENMILLVGRHGSTQKNSELMLKVFEVLGDIGDWKVVFVGPMTKEFKALLDSFFEKHPHYRAKITAPGNISDKGSLFSYYSRSKIFCLPSRWEGFPLVCPEALYFGNVLLVSDKVIASHDLTDAGQAGFILEGENVSAWAEKLAFLMNDQGVVAEYSRRSENHFQNNLIWKNILKKLDARIRQSLGSHSTE